MNGRRGMTLVEIVVVVAILAILAALVTPSLMEARRAAQRTRCMSNLRQIHAAIALYRTAEGKDGVYGEPQEMGLPPSSLNLGARTSLTQPADIFTCHGETALPYPNLVYRYYFTDGPDPDPARARWGRLVRRYGDQMVLISDEFHDFSTVGAFSPARTHRGIAVYLGGYARTVVRRGLPGTHEFYLPEVTP